MAANDSWQAARAKHLETHMDAFGYKTSWIVLKADSIASIANALQLSETQPMDWNGGIALGYEAVRLGNRRMFVSGLFDGWYFVLGDIPEPTNEIEAFDKLMGSLTAVSPDVQYFISNRVGDGYGWVRYRDRKQTRRVIWYSGEAHFEHGKPDDLENSVIKSWEGFDDGDGPYTLGPDEDDVLKIAKGWSLDPSLIDRPKSDVTVGIVGSMPKAE